MATIQKLTWSPQKNPPILGGNVVVAKSEKLYKTLCKVWRYNSLFSLPLFSKEKKISELDKILVEASAHVNQAIDFTEVQKQLQKSFSTLGDRISHLYLPEIESDIGIGKKILEFQKDTKRIQAAPFKKARCGTTKGPTCLVSYPVENGLRAFVIKYLDHQIEPVTNQIFNQFSKCFSEKSISLGFLVPMTSRVDFETHVYETPRHQEKLSEAMEKKLQTKFEQLTKAMKIERAVKHLMITEKVAGQNLIEFASQNYNKLEKEGRKKLFERIGRLSLLDLILGNRDRFIRVEQIDGKYVLDNESESNLGNLMVEPFDGHKEFQLYAIDNEIDLNPEYQNFLKGLLSKKDYFHLLVEHIVICFTRALENQADDIRESGQNIKVLLKPIKEEVATIAAKELLTGMEDMMSWLKQTFPKIWETEKLAIGLKNHVKETFPDLLVVIEERLKVIL